MGRRIESPSSINTYQQCPRKYFYRYVLKLPSGSNIHLIRGKVVHSVLEDFFTLNLDGLHNNNFEEYFAQHLLSLFHLHWGKAIPDFHSLSLSKEDIRKYYTDSLVMLENFLRMFSQRIRNYIAVKHVSFPAAFYSLKPLAEVGYSSESFAVRGFIDAIEQREDGVYLIDYKTSNKFEVTTEYRLQLGIYALLYYEKHGVLPQMVGIYFLKFGEKYLPVDEQLLRYAKKEIQYVHERTGSNSIEDYPKNVSPLCKWSTGQCDYYDVCFGQKTLDAFTHELVHIKTDVPSETND